MNKNRFDGLRFRIMETLEKAKNVPLTAREIAVRLHADEYKDQLQDHVVFRVTQAVHQMKGQGKVVQHDARGEGGQLTYVLPNRMAFSQKKDDTPPVNPVLKPELAEKIVAVEKKEPPKRPPTIAVGVPEKIVDILDKAPHPLALSEIITELGDPWNGHYKGNDLKTTVAGILLGLFKQHRIKRVSSSGRVPKVQYEYLTKKTKQKVYVPPEVPTVAVSHTKPVEPRNKKLLAQPAIGQSWDRQIKQTQPLFRPGAPKKVEKAQLNFEVPAEMHEAWKADAARFGVSVAEFVRDAVEFARSYAGDE